MKKVLLIVLAGGMFAMYSCGPSAEELAAEKKRVDDSVAAVQAEAQRVADSTTAAAVEAQRIADSTNAAAETQRVADSTAAADAKKGSKPKAKPTAKKEDPKVPVTDRGTPQGEQPAKPKVTSR